MKKYLVCQHRKKAIEIVGIFSTPEKADDACRDWSYYMMELEEDEAAPHESTSAVVYYPRTNQTVVT